MGMYKILLVDDERIILEGIAAVIEWEKLDTVLIGKAGSGREAYEMVEQNPPHIIITDVKMPELDGIGLIEKVKARYPDISFIILSGHDEFEFAKTAMQYGVRHYLLKPCNENKITEAIHHIIQEIREKERKDLFVQNVRYSLDKVLPKIKEQFLKDCLTDKTYGEREWKFYSELLNLDLQYQSVRLLLLSI